MPIVRVILAGVAVIALAVRPGTTLSTLLDVDTQCTAARLYWDTENAQDPKERGAVYLVNRAASGDTQRLIADIPNSEAVALNASRPAVNANPRPAIPRQIIQAAAIPRAVGLCSKGSYPIHVTGRVTRRRARRERSAVP